VRTALRRSRTRAVVSLVSLALCAGCHHSASAAGPTEALAQTPAPFASPPILAGTPDIATLAAKVKPSVVNITTVQEVKVPKTDFPFPGFPGFEGMFPFFHQG